MTYKYIASSQRVVSLSRKAALATLADTKFDVTPHISFTSNLAERLKIDLSATIMVMRHLPLWTSGSEHTILRRAVAQFLAEDRLGKVRRATLSIRARANQMLFGAGDVIDLHAFLCETVDTFMEEVTGLPRFVRGGNGIPNMFSSYLSVSARRRLEETLRKHFEIARCLFPDEDEVRIAIRVGQILMGRDALIGSLGATLHRHLLRLDGARLCDHPLAAVPTDTGVPLIGRIAAAEVRVDGCPIHPGDLVECRLDSFNGGKEAERLKFFGAGAHICLGRSLALDFFEIMADVIRTCPFGMQVLKYRLRRDDVFHMPSEFVTCKKY